MTSHVFKRRARARRAKVLRRQFVSRRSLWPTWSFQSDLLLAAKMFAVVYAFAMVEAEFPAIFGRPLRVDDTPDRYAFAVPPA